MQLKTVCARCGHVLREGDEADGPVSHGLCLHCLPDVHDVHVEHWEHLPQEVFDSLPYGVIRLDEDGNVIAYNLAQSGLSRREPARTLGRNFFLDVAPCTNVHELVGWFEEAKRVGHAPLKTVRFLFAFPHGMQYVRLSLAFNGYDRTTTIVVDVIQEEEDDE